MEEALAIFKQQHAPMLEWLHGREYVTLDKATGVIRPKEQYTSDDRVQRMVSFLAIMAREYVGHVG
jgi:hypothetical protein